MANTSSYQKITNTYICPLCGSKTKDYYCSSGDMFMGPSDIKCSNRSCFFSSNYVPYKTWNYIGGVKQNELKLHYENREQAARISELEKSAIIWHKYPDEKPYRPMCKTLPRLVDWMVMIIAVYSHDKNEYIVKHDTYHWDIDGTGYFDNQVSKDDIMYFTYLPEPPKEVK